MTTRRGTRPHNASVSKKTAAGLSELRRAEIHERTNQIIDAKSQSRIPAAIAHSSLFKKVATFGQTVGPTSSSHSDRIGPEVYSPLFQLANLNLPRDRVTMNAWNRVFYDTHPIVRNAINLHSSYPISKINITCKSKKVQQFFTEMAEEIDLYSVVYGAALEFWKMGEAFPYAELDKDRGVWKRITILNPDYVHVEKPSVGDKTIVSLRPDSSLQRLVNSNSPKDMAMKRRIPGQILEHVKKGLNIPLDDFNISHLKLLSSPYDIRGTSIIVSVYKDLMLYDKLRESKFAQADGMINPLTLVKLGGSEGYRPTQSDIDSFRMVLEEAQYDKDFKLVTHDGVTIERVGFSGAVLDIAGDIELINNNIYTGLQVPKALMDQESATYASSSVGLEVLRQRYDIFRNMIKKWLEQKIFAPICEIQEFFEYVDGQKRLVVPQVDFNHMNLYDVMDYVQNLANYVANKQVSKHTLYRSLGISYEEEQARLRKELIDEAIMQKEQESMMTMRLSELRNLDPEKPIPEPVAPADGGGGMDEEMPPGMEDLPGMGGGGGPPALPGMGGGGGDGGPMGDLGGEGGAPPMGGAPDGGGEL